MKDLPHLKEILFLKEIVYFKKKDINAYEFVKTGKLLKLLSDIVMLILTCLNGLEKELL